MLTLADLIGMTELEIISHIATNYAGSVSGFDYGTPSKEEESKLAYELTSYNILVAYESVGSWGCDSSSWFLLQHKTDKTYHSIHGSHCSCFGFEGQGDIEEVALEYLKSDNFYLYIGGYDEDSEANTIKVKEFISTLPD